MIVAVIGEKGGTGKTTFAAHLAGWRSVSGRDVMLVDADRQESSTRWVNLRQERDLPAPESVQKFARGLRRAVLDLSRRYDDVIVDIGAGDGVAMETALRVADAAVVPLQPNEMDMWTVDFLDELAADSKELNENLVVRAVLNRAPSHHTARDVRAALKAFADFPQIRPSEFVVHERSSIRRAVPAGCLIDEWRPRDIKGQQELAQVYRLVFGTDAPIRDANNELRSK